MKKGAKLEKLRLTRETLRRLSAEDAALIRGGDSHGSGSTCMNGSCGDCTTYMFSCGCGSCDCP